jgi:hydroxymethylpyrimidine pyrophosphatase-like HAD family hydrolase
VTQGRDRISRILYADLDGTLLGPGGSLFATPDGLTRAAADAVGALHEAGVSLVLVSGRTREQMREAARILQAEAYIAELGAFVVERPDDVLPNFGEFRESGRPFDAMARSGVGGFLLERYAGTLEPHTPWSLEGREATMLFRGLLDPAEASVTLAKAGYRWLELLDNGIIARTYPTLDVQEVRAYHLVPRGVNKASGVRLHRERAGAAIARTAVIGDSVADAQIAGEVGTAFIVGPASGLDAEAERPENLRVLPDPAGLGFARAVHEVLDMWAGS